MCLWKIAWSVKDISNFSSFHQYCTVYTFEFLNELKLIKEVILIYFAPCFLTIEGHQSLLYFYWWETLVDFKSLNIIGLFKSPFFCFYTIFRYCLLSPLATVHKHGPNTHILTSNSQDKLVGMAHLSPNHKPPRHQSPCQPLQHTLLFLFHIYTLTQLPLHDHRETRQQQSAFSSAPQRGPHHNNTGPVSLPTLCTQHLGRGCIASQPTPLYATTNNHRTVAASRLYIIQGH